MADDQYLLEDLEDEGEEVDYDDFNLEDEDLDDPATVEEATGNAKRGEELISNEPPPDFEDGTMEGTVAGTSDTGQPAKEATAPEQGQSTETVEEANKQPSTAGGRAPIPAPNFGKGQEGSMPQPHSRGPTPPPGVPNGMGMPRPGPGMPGLPMPPGMLLPGQMMGTRPMQMMPRPMPLPPAQPPPPLGRGPAPALQSPDRQRGGRHAPIPAPQPPPREPVRWQQPPGSRGQLQMGGPDHPRGPAGLPMPPNMAHLMFHGPLLPHLQPPSSGSFGGRQDQRSPGASQPMANGVRPRPLASGGRGSAGDYNLALGMDASAASRNPQHRGAPGGKPSVGVPQRLQGRLEDPAPLLGLLRPRDVAEELRQKEERQEAERAMARAKEAQEKKKAEELKAKRLEMAKLQIQLQQAENRKNQALFAGVVAADERARKQREAEEFEAMKLRVMQLEKLVAAAAPASAPASAPKACAPAPSVAAAPPAAATQPQKEAETAPADAGLQVDFDDDEEEEEETAAQAAPQQQPARLPIAARLGSKDTKTAPAPTSRPVRSQVRMDQIDRPTKEKRRPQRSSPASEDMEADEEPGHPPLCRPGVQAREMHCLGLSLVPAQR
ncbi:hypothetical protein WJX75_000044 [Coccomyxa subellipsoidea]|uniref:Uncharacterized protein n=1 Tax=Coccomyxa subellipsoidea TaxID=248742 RepID=A0ABR2YRR1_9CHLO